MFVVRPVQYADVPALLKLVAASAGNHTLPRTPHTMEQAVGRSLAAFAASPAAPGDEWYLFVLQSDRENGLAGCAAIAATAGGNSAYFAFRNDAIQQVSRDLGISHGIHTLSLSSDLSAHSQLSGFLLSAHAAGGAAELLSRSRLLFSALAPQRFAEQFFAALPGSADGNGRFPFWEALGRKFFGMDLLQAEHVIEGARNRSLIVELMPPYPVYVPLLPADAQAALGRAHEAAVQRLNLLHDEGFEAGRHIDIFDGGPILQARRTALRTSAQARRRTVDAVPAQAGQARCLVAAAREQMFRVVEAMCDETPDETGTLRLPEAARRMLDVAAGDVVLCVNAG